MPPGPSPGYDAVMGDALARCAVTLLLASLAGCECASSSTADARPPAVDEGLPSVSGTTVHATSCSASGVQAAIDAASDGFTVEIPAGTCTWYWPVAVPAEKSLVIRGAGVGATVIVGAAGEVDLLRIAVRDGGFTRVTDLTFDQQNVDVGGKALIAFSIASIDAFRVDHCEMRNLHERGIWIRGSQSVHAMGGLVDHVAFYCGLESGVCQAASVDLCSGEDGQTLMDLPLDLGGPSFTFFEDDELFYDQPQDGSIEGYGCARVVERFDRYHGAGFGHHGTDSGNQRGTQAYEYYRNDVDVPLVRPWSGRIAHLRSGNGMIFDNTIGAGVVGGMSYYLYRANWATPDTSDPEFHPAWAGLCDGTSAYDGNVGLGSSAYPAAGYPCLDGAGHTFDALAGRPGGHVVWGPNYVFGNRRGSEIVVADTHNPMHVAPDVDFFGEVPDFDGSSGVGVGTRAEMDALTPTLLHAGFWVTDEGEWNATNGAAPDGRLYVWDGAGWRLFYTPYTYPHPLQSR